MILIAYDGSADARAAIERAAQLFPNQSATVLTLWQPFAQVVAHTSVGFGLVPSLPDAGEIDEASMKAATETASEGAELARSFGMTAEPQIGSELSTTGRGILAEADRADADAIVMGSRGLTGLKSLLLGSVSNEVIQRADRTVVIVPSPEVADSRARDVEAEAAG